MTILKISANSNGSHDNQTSSAAFGLLPEGWAVVPEHLGTPETLENFPFGDITAEETDGTAAVTSWTPLPMPEGV